MNPVFLVFLDLGWAFGPLNRCARGINRCARGRVASPEGEGLFQNIKRRWHVAQATLTIAGSIMFTCREPRLGRWRSSARAAEPPKAKPLALGLGSTSQANKMPALCMHCRRMAIVLPVLTSFCRQTELYPVQNWSLEMP